MISDFFPFYINNFILNMRSLFTGSLSQVFFVRFIFIKEYLFSSLLDGVCHDVLFLRLSPNDPILCYYVIFSTSNMFFVGRITQYGHRVVNSSDSVLLLKSGTQALVEPVVSHWRRRFFYLFNF